MSLAPKPEPGPSRTAAIAAAMEGINLPPAVVKDLRIGDVVFLAVRGEYFEIQPGRYLWQLARTPPYRGDPAQRRCELPAEERVFLVWKRPPVTR